MKEELFTKINSANGEQQTCVLKEKFNNENGQTVYRFQNQQCGEDYLIVRNGNQWETLNDCQLPASNVKELTDFADGLDQ